MLSNEHRDKKLRGRVHDNRTRVTQRGIQFLTNRKRKHTKISVRISPSPPKTGSLNYYFSVQKVPFRRYSDSFKNIWGAEVLQNEVSDDSVHIFRFGSRILPTRVNYKSQTRHATDPFYDGPVDIYICMLPKPVGVYTHVRANAWGHTEYWTCCSALRPETDIKLDGESTLHRDITYVEDVDSSAALPSGSRRCSSQDEDIDDHADACLSNPTGIHMRIAHDRNKKSRKSSTSESI